MPSDKAMIKDVVEIVDNPFDVSKNQFLGVDSKKGKKEKNMMFYELNWISNRRT
jgi:hypothetical protein